MSNDSAFPEEEKSEDVHMFVCLLSWEANQNNFYDLYSLFLISHLTPYRARENDL